MSDRRSPDSLALAVLADDLAELLQIRYITSRSPHGPVVILHEPGDTLGDDPEPRFRLHVTPIDTGAPFAESDALLAALEGRKDEAEAIVKGLSGPDARALFSACVRLAVWAEQRFDAEGRG